MSYFTPTMEDFKAGVSYEFKERFMDGTVKTQKDFDDASWINAIYTDGDSPYVNRALNGKNHDVTIRKDGKSRNNISKTGL